MIGFSIMQSHLWKKLLKPLFADTLRNLKRICLLSHWQSVAQFFHIRIMVFFLFSGNGRGKLKTSQCYLGSLKF